MYCDNMKLSKSDKELLAIGFFAVLQHLENMECIRCQDVKYASTAGNQSQT
jgi:hypothetical protein